MIAHSRADPPPRGLRAGRESSRLHANSPRGGTWEPLFPNRHLSRFSWAPFRYLRTPAPALFGSTQGGPGIRDLEEGLLPKTNLLSDGVRSLGFQLIQRQTKRGRTFPFQVLVASQHRSKCPASGPKSRLAELPVSSMYGLSRSEQLPYRSCGTNRRDDPPRLAGKWRLSGRKNTSVHFHMQRDRFEARTKV